MTLNLTFENVCKACAYGFVPVLPRLLVTTNASITCHVVHALYHFSKLKTNKQKDTNKTIVRGSHRRGQAEKRVINFCVRGTPPRDGGHDITAARVEPTGCLEIMTTAMC